MLLQSVTWRVDGAEVFQRARGVLSRLLSSSTSAWVAVPVGFSLAVLVAAAFGGDRSLVPFAVYVVVVVVSGVVTSRTVLATNVGLALTALFFGAVALGLVTAAVSVVAHHGRSSIGLVVVFLAVAIPTGAVCGVFVRQVVRFEREMRAASTTNNERPSGQI